MEGCYRIFTVKKSQSGRYLLSQSRGGDVQEAVPLARRRCCNTATTTDCNIYKGTRNRRQSRILDMCAQNTCLQVAIGASCRGFGRRRKGCAARMARQDTDKPQNLRL